MSASLRALLTGVIDYAGMFPPAKLPLEEAIRNYARYLFGPEELMLGRFLCPTPRLEELGPHCKRLFLEQPCIISAVGRGGSTSDEISSGLKEDMNAMTMFKEERARVDTWEIRLPPGYVGDDLLPLFAAMGRAWCALSGRMACYEIAYSDGWKASVIRVLPTLVRRDPLPTCFKMRCGGLEASAFPSPEQVAFVIAACRDEDVPIKFTAGLHHPIRHYNVEVQTKMHGFINVFVAGVLAHTLRLSEEQLLPIIEDEDASHFRFDDDGLRWKDFSATTEQIAATRKHVLSFGSCSFDEPREDLKKLGWLP
jgi:hypothetical protein